MSRRREEMDLDQLVTLYLRVKEKVSAAGYDGEIQWQETVEFRQVTERVFLQEAAWVVLSAGFRESTVRNCFGSLSEAFRNWRSAEEIVANQEDCEKRAMEAFGNRRKIEAIGEIAKCVAEDGIERIKTEIGCRGVEYLQRFPFIGPVTSYHLAKNLGLNVVKPDRHLVRMAWVSGHECPLTMCLRVADVVGDAVAVVDLVFWRYATMNGDYETEFRSVSGTEEPQN